jgi:hypothetical protein
MISLLFCLGRSTQLNFEIRSYSSSSGTVTVGTAMDHVLATPTDTTPPLYCSNMRLYRHLSSDLFWQIECDTFNDPPAYAYMNDIDLIHTNITNIEGRILGDALMTNTKINNLLKPNAIPVKEYDEIKTISSIAITGLVFAVLHFILHIIVMCIQRSGNNDSEQQADANYA